MEASVSESASAGSGVEPTEAAQDNENESLSVKEALTGTAAAAAVAAAGALAGKAGSDEGEQPPGGEADDSSGADGGDNPAYDPSHGIETRGSDASRHSAHEAATYGSDDSEDAT